ncbi:hypothetical protein [Nostoc sp. TCL240-02]|uniref:hypothetical protein n=1 Tax=Nostoc sp. TCL240-02 TaxID=2572090 RepID=UPI00157F9F16|nr:hypothetical protein [Nostoc sp. TCL240-02]QKQ75578.1 hypothetical protein FBB35_21855 [Nostoc sp. TCL240-02]
MPQRNISSQIGNTFYQIGRYFSSGVGDGSLVSASMLAGQIFYCPIIIPQTITVDRIAVNVGTGQTAGEARLAMRYFSNSSKSVGRLLFDAATVDCSTSGAKEITINQIIQPGYYMGLLWNKIASTTYTAYTNSPLSGSIVGQTSVGVSFLSGFTLTGITYGSAFPDSPESGAPGTPNNNCPILSLRIAG